MLGLQARGLRARKPVIPGHEITGRVVRVGPKVTEFKVGDRAGVGYVIYLFLVQELSLILVSRQSTSLFLLSLCSL
jgi:NADPH:quinone reductase-like Zn-dependent oxidoreductase